MSFIYLHTAVSSLVDILQSQLAPQMTMQNVCKADFRECSANDEGR